MQLQLENVPTRSELDVVDASEFTTTDGNVTGSTLTTVNEQTQCIAKIDTLRSHYVDRISFYFTPSPTCAPTTNPTKKPTNNPSMKPSLNPSMIPIVNPISNTIVSADPNEIKGDSDESSN